MEGSGVARPRRPFRQVTSLVLTASAVAAMLALGLPGIQVAPSGADPVVQVAPGYGALPLSFEPNQGQAAPEVLFSARGADYGLYLTATEAVLTLSRPGREGEHDGPVTDTVRMSLLGANPDPEVRGEDVLPGRVNYLAGDDPTRWVTDVPTYGRVSYAGVYPGVDLDYYGRQGHVKYDFLVAPGADPGVIRLAVSGAQALSLDDEGNLVLETPGGRLVHHAPILYQEHEDGPRPVEGSYLLEGDQVSFSVGAYDSGRPLVIDPELSYSSYLGGSSSQAGEDIAVDAQGSAYVTGITTSADFPTAGALQSSRQGEFDAFVTKLSPDGRSLVYSTYLGGEGFEEGRGIAVDAAGNAYVTGTTLSETFPTVNAVQPEMSGFSEDVFVAKLNPTGSALVYSTYLGGERFDNGRDIAVDASGSAYVTGVTFSDDFPTADAFQATRNGIDTNAFVTKLNPAGSTLVYSTYLGGLADEGNGIAVDSSGSAYVTGSTLATDFPTANAFQPSSGGRFDAFVTKLVPAGSALAYSTYLGGSENDNGYGVAVDSSGAAYVTGDSESTDFPTASPVQASLRGPSDAFVTKVTPAGSALAYSTYLGGTSCCGDSGGFEEGRSIAVSGPGGAYVTGVTSSDDFPLVDPLQPRPGGFFNFFDAFVTHVNPAGSALVYSTYLGGSDVEGAGGGTDEGNGITVDAVGSAYVTGETSSANFPTVNAFQPDSAPGSVGDAFVAKITQASAPPTTTSSTAPPTTTSSTVATTTTSSTQPPTTTTTVGPTTTTQPPTTTTTVGPTTTTQPPTTTTTLPPTTTTAAPTTTTVASPTTTQPTTTTTMPQTTTSTSRPATTTTVPGPGGDPVQIDDTVLSNGDTVRITGTISCEEGRRFRIQMTVAQDETLGERLRAGRCNGRAQRFSVLGAVGSGPRFHEGRAQVDVVAQIGVPGQRTIEDTFTASGEVIIEVPGGFMGQVLAGFLALDGIQRGPGEMTKIDTQRNRKM